MQLRHYSRWPHSFLQDIAHSIHQLYYFVYILYYVLYFAGDSMLMSSHGVSTADTMDVFEFSMCSSGS